MSLLILHQIDAAYWKEWEMFYVSGGIQVFLVFNLVILLVGSPEFNLPASLLIIFLCLLSSLFQIKQTINDRTKRSDQF